MEPLTAIYEAGQALSVFWGWLFEATKDLSLVISLFAVAISILAWFFTKRMAQGHFFAEFLREYSNYDMCRYVRRLMEWQDKHGDTFIDDWWKGLLKGEPKAYAIDKARRYISSYFYRTEELAKAGLISKSLKDKIFNQLGNKDFKKYVVDAMSNKFAEENYPIIAEEPLKEDNKNEAL